MCGVCSRMYYTKSGLQAHQRQVHTAGGGTGAGGAFRCADCADATFETKYDLLLHRKEHRGANPEKCTVCGARFPTPVELKRHRVACHSNRPYACPHCPHRSKTRDKLDRHMVCHTSKDTYRCQHCDKTFAFKNSLKKHLEKGRCAVLKQSSGPPVQAQAYPQRKGQGQGDSTSNEAAAPAADPLEAQLRALHDQETAVGKEETTTTMRKTTPSLVVLRAGDAALLDADQLPPGMMVVQRDGGETPTQQPLLDSLECALRPDDPGGRGAAEVVF